MNQTTSILQKLSHYGVDAAKLSERQLQQKIIQMYDFLEQTTTENLLLRKQNDDLSLQINTIQSVFIDAQNTLTSTLSPRTYQNIHNQPFFYHQQPKTNLPQSSPTPSTSKQNMPVSSHHQISHSKQPSHHQYLVQNRNSQHESVQTKQKTPRCAAKPHRNSRFCSDPQVIDKEKTSRIGSGDNLIAQTQNSLNEKIQILMKQNQIIMKRMNQIEVNFIKKSQNEHDNSKFHKNFDDRSTHFSNITSIQNIWPKKDFQNPSKSINRTHYSTSNLRTYCPSVE